MILFWLKLLCQTARLLASSRFSERVHPVMTPPIISVIGKSGSGKTTLIEKILTELRRRGYRVATIKHHFHTDETLDAPGKDTYRHAMAGAERVVLISPLTTVAFDYPAQPPTPQDVASQMTGFNLVITEGFSQASLPAIEVSRAARQKSLIGDPACLLAVAADYPVEATCPVFDLNDTAGLVALIEQQIIHTPSQSTF